MSPHRDKAERSAYNKKWRARNALHLRERWRQYSLSGKRAEWWRKNSYGITQTEYESLLLAQESVCGLCRRPFSEDESPCVDHDHESGKVRGIVHKSCNTILGMAMDDPAILESAAAYLRKSHGEKA